MARYISGFRLYGMILPVGVLLAVLVVSWHSESNLMVGLEQENASGSVSDFKKVVPVHQNSSHSQALPNITTLLTTSALANYDGADEVPPFWPVRMMQQYKRWHSASALETDPGIGTRQFAIVYFYCPNRAGNILHNLFNSVGENIR
jgi:hypothetical protein